MAATPWTAGPAGTASAVSDELASPVVLASRLTVRRWRDVPAFLRSSMHVRSAAVASPGCIGVSLDAHVARRTFLTLSAWVDEAALEAFVSGDVHRDVMRRWAGALDGTRFEQWRAEGIPSWRDARDRLTAVV